MDSIEEAMRLEMKGMISIDLKAQNDNEHQEAKMSHSLLELVLKAFKTHRCTADIDSKWISDVVGTMRNPILLE